MSSHAVKASDAGGQVARHIEYAKYSYTTKLIVEKIKIIIKV